MRIGIVFAKGDIARPRLTEKKQAAPIIGRQAVRTLEAPGVPFGAAERSDVEKKLPVRVFPENRTKIAALPVAARVSVNGEAVALELGNKLGFRR